MRSLLYAAVFGVCLCGVSQAAQNFTVDDGDPSITYTGQWNDTLYDPLNAGGSHKVTGNPDATASFTFTGTAIYFYSSLWPFRVTTSLTLDNEDPFIVDLRDHHARFIKDGPETTQSDVVWYQLNLENKEHTLLISVASGEDLAVVDALVYTVPDPNDPTTPPSPSSTSHSRLLPNPTSTPTQGATSSGEPKQGLAIALGIVCTVFGLFVIYGAYWYWRRRKRLAEEEAYIAADDDGNDNPEMADATNARPSFYRSPFLRDASAAAAAARALKGKRRKPPPPPRAPRSSVKRAAAAAAAMRAKNPLSTIPETTDANGRPMSIASRSSSYQQQETRRESIGIRPPSPVVSPAPNTSTTPGQDPWAPRPSTGSASGKS